MRNTALSTMEQTADSGVDAVGGRRLTAGVLALLAGLAAIGTLSTTIILPSFSSIGASLGVNARDLGLTLSSFFMAFAVGQLVVGPLSDRFGRRLPVLGGLAVFLIGSAVCASADSMTVLILGRVVQALGVCAASVLSRAIARDLFDGEALARVLALTMVAMAAAPGFSPLLGGALDALFGWRAAFVLVGVMAALLAAFYALGTGETHPPDRRSAWTPSAVGSAYGRLLTDRRFILPALSVSLVIGGLYAFFGAAPAILMTALGFSPLQLGLFFAATVFVVFGAGLLAPRLAHRWTAPRVATAGILLCLAGGVILLGGGGTADLTLFTVAIAVFLFGMGLVNPLGTAIALHPFGRQAGLASALLGFLQMVCAAAGAALATALPQPPVGALAITMAGAAALSLLAFLGLRASPAR
ncbi:multidrug effflux MFS transporter [Azospirillum sp. RWY-5-1]|uniref:Bcr/CflA family efflux transporter n=1 Tax=Azospirillum oleiclasticum TaxID=2735135 RepID=A0ABX2TFU6_9PROT|nr:multidrug effflux MFS transporter [Azospirillum oleiclasticum]NYZ15787.1 multidrug effflux MFS transporter [Azospirillum oleiclasticum]NYZ22057.1 multidrug effflux MFS transporter [Azospirillum oleiclasticum]